MEQDPPMLEKEAGMSREMSEEVEEGGERTPTLQQQIDDMKQTFTFMTHQVNQIMKSLHVTGCECPTCQQVMQRQKAAAGVKALEDLARAFSQPPADAPATPSEDPSMDEEAAAKHLISQLFPQGISDFNAISEHITPKPQLFASTGGRRSKYCTPEEKREVAEYASVHGAAAAARKFNIPAPVAAYYQRKAAKQQNKMAEQLNGLFGTPGTPDKTDEAGTMSDLKMGSQPTPGNYLRGRGRGRPKLIGDELDADLVEYMVELKKQDPGHHLTASQALQIARDYILKRNPGLLEECGGHIKLKLTWAMKLVQRIQDREKEIELGLPAGALSSLGKMAGANMPGGSMMSDMMSQNILGQHLTNIMSQMTEAPIEPEVVNVKLSLSGDDEAMDTFQKQLDSPESTENHPDHSEVVSF